MLYQSLIILLLSVIVNADYTDGTWKIYKRAPLVVLGCEQIIGKTALYFPATDVIGYCNTNNQPALGTITHALKMSNSSQAIAWFVNNCNTIVDDGFTMDDFNRAYDNATQYLTDVTTDDLFNITQVYNKPALLTQTKVDAGINSTVNRFQNYNYGSIFGLVLNAYWFLLVILSGVWNLLKFITPNVVKKIHGGLINKLRQYITLPAMFANKHNDYYYIFKVWPTLLPTRLETLMIGGWLVLVLAFNVCNYEHNVGNTIWPIQSTEMGRKIADRTGYEIIFMFPVLILFAGRNNFLQLITGWNQSRFILIHKWVARVVSLLALIHGVGMTYNGKGLGKYETRNAEPYVQWGIVATVAMFLMCFLAMNALRKNNYELFKLVHIIFAAIVIAGSWLHVADHELENFYYCTTAVWCFDRFIRIVRMIGFGIKTATVELIADETLKVTVARPSYWKSFAGAHAFVYFMRPTTFWQSHPFTIVDEVKEANTLTFYLKIKGGMTNSLYQYLKNQPNQTANIPISVEGPYGKRLPLSRYDNQIFISSGNGIPGLYEEAKQLINHKTNGTLNIKFIWIIRHFKSIEWFYQELLNLENSGMNIDIYITNGSLGVNQFWNNDSDTVNDESPDQLEHDKLEPPMDQPSEKVESIIEELKAKLSHVNFIEQRPNIEELVINEITEANNGSIAIASCCHASIDDAIRRSVANNLDKSPHRIDLFDQIQVW